MSPRTYGVSLGGGIRLATGSYTGDGAATQAITGVGFQPTFIVVYWQEASVDSYGLKTDQDGLNTKYFCGTVGHWRYEADNIISLDVDGFTVGDGSLLVNVFNVNLQDYSFVAFR